jgi:twitching motility protein PilT
MPKLDIYLRSIKQLGARGAVLTSGQAVTLRFSNGDRHATQITSHDQLVGLVRDIAPPGALDLLDKARAATFEIESSGARWSINVAPRGGAWQVAIDPVELPPVIAAMGSATRMPRVQTPPPVESETGGIQAIALERGQYSAPSLNSTTSGSALLDQLTASARMAAASDVFLSAGSPAFLRIGNELTSASDRTPLDAETLARELGLVAPTEARAAWTQHGLAMFAYGDGHGRVRVTLTRDHRGPGAALRLLPAEAPTMASLGLGGVADWLQGRGLIAIAGPSGSGKTTALASLVRALGEQRRRVITLEDPIEIVHVSPWISQRAIGEHVPSLGDGVVAAMREGADAIVVGAAQTSAEVAAVIEAVAGGHLVLTTLVAPRAGVAVDRMLDRLAAEHRDMARALCADALLGAIGPIMTRSGRSFEVAERGIAS